MSDDVVVAEASTSRACLRGFGGAVEWSGNEGGGAFPVPSSIAYWLFLMCVCAFPDHC